MKYIAIILFVLIGLALIGFAGFVSIQSRQKKQSQVVLDEIEELVDVIEQASEEELATHMSTYEVQYHVLEKKASQQTKPLDSLAKDRKRRLDQRFESLRFSFRLKERQWVHTLDETERWLGRLEDSTTLEVDKNWESIEARFEETQSQIESNWESINDSLQDDWFHLQKRFNALEERLAPTELAHT